MTSKQVTQKWAVVIQPIFYNFHSSGPNLPVVANDAFPVSKDKRSTLYTFNALFDLIKILLLRILNKEGQIKIRPV